MSNFIQSIFIKRRNEKKRKRLVNKDFTIISSNCIAGVIYHDLGLQFNSPTINLWFEPKDYLIFLENLETFLESDDLIEYKDNRYSYPVGILCGKVKLYFQHYKSFKEAKHKWENRKKRVNTQNIYVIMTDRDKATLKEMKAFDRLKYRNKIILTGKEYEGITNQYCIQNCKEHGHLGDVFSKSRILGKKKLDEFDYVSFLNNELND